MSEAAQQSLSHRALVIDDDEDTRALIEKYLSAEGCEVFLAKDAFEAMEYLDRYPFQFVLLDINMPFKNGFTLLESLRSRRSFQLLPIALMSARNSQVDIERAARLGADTYILKPIQKKDFLKKVYQLARQSPRQRTFKVSISKQLPISKGRIFSNDDCEILSISDSTIEVRTPQQLRSKQKVQVNSPIFAEIGLTHTKFTVLKIISQDDDLCVAQLMFPRINEETVINIRKWIETQNRSKSRS